MNPIPALSYLNLELWPSDPITDTQPLLTNRLAMWASLLLGT